MGKSVKINKKFEQLLISAERYALGRRTYIVSETVEYISTLSPLLSDWCLDILLCDLGEAFERDALGDGCDWFDWTRLVRVLTKEREKRGKEEKRSP